MNLPITVLIAARNEEKNLPECLSSVAGFDQVFVVDSGSTDRSEEIVKAAGAEFVTFRYDGGWPKKRNWAIRNLPIRNDWVLILDADERVSPELAAEMAEAIGDPDVNGYYVRWKFIFLDRWMRHCWSHGWMLRLIRKGKGEYEDLGMRGEGGWDTEVHENVVVEGSCGRLRSWLDHDSRENLSFWLRKQNEFSDWNARRRLKQLESGIPPLTWILSPDPGRQRRCLKSLFIRMPLKPFLLFVWLYVVKLGFLDGKAGWYFCLLRASHELNIGAKMYEATLSAER